MKKKYSGMSETGVKANIKKLGELVFGNQKYGIPLDYRDTEIGRQNWEVCARMLMHDLLDLAPSNPDLAEVLKHYKISYMPDGGYTMSLPRMGSLGTLPKKAKK